MFQNACFKSKSHHSIDKPTHGTKLIKKQNSPMVGMSWRAKTKKGKLTTINKTVRVELDHLIPSRCVNALHMGLHSDGGSSFHFTNAVFHSIGVAGDAINTTQNVLPKNGPYALFSTRKANTYTLYTYQTRHTPTMFEWIWLQLWIREHKQGPIKGTWRVD